MTHTLPALTEQDVADLPLSSGPLGVSLSGVLHQRLVASPHASLLRVGDNPDSSIFLKKKKEKKEKGMIHGDVM